MIVLFDPPIHYHCHERYW